MIIRIQNLPLTAILAASMAIAGVPGLNGQLLLAPSKAEAASQSIYKISQVGPGVSKNLKLGLNKAIVIDLPVDAHDVLVADPEVADAVTRTSTRLYIFGKAVGQTNVFIFGAGGEELVTIELARHSQSAGAIASLHSRLRHQGRDHFG
mgnify:CR=1 FL=1